MIARPFISIITASFNNDATIKKTIESIKNQTFKDVEHIVIDNCSTDSTIDILEGYKGSYNFQWISEPDKGIADALNKGLQKASGQYIIVIHADDHLLENDTLDKVYLHLGNGEYDIVCFPIIMDHPINGRILCHNQSIWKMHFKPFLRHQGAFVHRRLHEQIGNYNTVFSIAMDYDFFYRAVKHKAKIKLEDEYVTEMGGTGIGTDKRYLVERINQDYQVQKLNETNLLWIVLQFLYFFYKKYLRHLIRKSFENPNKINNN